MRNGTLPATPEPTTDHPRGVPGAGLCGVILPPYHPAARR
jgi:hypothetical protein